MFDIASVFAIISMESFIVLLFRAFVTKIAMLSRVLGPHSTSTWRVHGGVFQTIYVFSVVSNVFLICMDNDDDVGSEFMIHPVHVECLY